MLRASLLADARILPQARQGSYFFNRIGRSLPIKVTACDGQLRQRYTGGIPIYPAPRAQADQGRLNDPNQNQFGSSMESADPRSHHASDSAVPLHHKKQHA
ncbi:hypothetical protein EMIT0P294_70006 [Pseudomonas sp. IT-P294]